MSTHEAGLAGAFAGLGIVGVDGATSGRESAMSDYPQRESHWAHKLVRLMLRSCAAQDIGADGFTLVTAIAHTEDAKRYCGAVTFWNEQLMPLLGFNSWGQLDRARTKAVEAGWLHYECGGKRKVGRYWTTIPAGLTDTTDSDTSCDYHDSIAKNGDKAEIEAGQNRDRTGGEVVIEPGENRGRSGEHSSLALSLSPSPSDSDSDSDTEANGREKPKAHTAAERSAIGDPHRSKLLPVEIEPVGQSGASLRTLKDLDRATVRDWWQRHIAGEPLTGRTALDLLGVLCWAADCRAAPRRVTNRVGLFAAGLRSGKWRDVTTGLADEWDKLRPLLERGAVKHRILEDVA